jgi:hypothetical protein
MNQITKTLTIMGLVLSIITLSCKKEILPDDATVSSSRSDELSAPDQHSNKVIIEWSNIAWQVAGGPAEGHPPLTSRIEAMMHIAIHDALNAIAPVYRSYAYHPQEQFGAANPFAAAASAAHTVLRASWPDSASMLDAKLASSLSRIPDGYRKKQGIEVGIAAGKAILALRKGDGAYQNPVSDWPDSDVPGVYVKVPPNDFVFARFWGEIPPFALKTSKQFLPPPPPSLDSYIYTRDFNEVKHFGKLNSVVRTADQTFYAKFWFELSDIGWNRIARTEATAHNTGLYTTARMFALLNIALADSYIAFLEAQFYYKRWRPYTAIHEAAKDGNDKTKPNQTWEPLLPTPPVPDYPSGHSTLGNAAATVLTYFFGNSPFSTTSTTASPAGAVRSFKSFKQAAEENADSRVMVGIHFRFSCKAGLNMGEKVGKWTIMNYLEPLR